MAATVCKLVAGADVTRIAARRHLECRFGLPIFLACVYAYGYSVVRSPLLCSTSHTSEVGNKFILSESSK
jgi:hypothetical protein